MTYTHLTPTELVMIEAYFNQSHSVSKVAHLVQRSRQTIYNVYRFLKSGGSAISYYEQYKKNKRNCGRRPIVLPDGQQEYIQKKVAQGWTPDVLIGRAEFPIACSVRTLYRMFKDKTFDPHDLPMKGKRKPNGHQEKCGKQAFIRSIHERSNEYTSFEDEFGHLEGDTIVGQKHKSAVITLVERLSKVIITLKTRGRLAADIEDHEEYEERFETKKQNIITRLRDFDIIDENQNVPIVAVAANPFGEGFDYWLSNLDEYNQISHISDLQAATSEQIKKSGGANALVLATSQSIVKDIIQRQLPMVQQNVALAAEEINKFKSIISDVRKEQDSSERNISNARTELKEYITDLFTDLILQVKGTDIETIDEFFERNIGDEGIVLETTIQNEFERQLGKIAYEISKAETNFNASINHYNNMVGDLAIQGMKISKEFLKNAKVSSKTILTTRDFLMPTFKFKPWGAIKLADKISKGFAVTGALLGIALEAFDSYSKAKQEKEFNIVKNAIAESFIKQRKDYITFINNPQDFIGQFFPSYFDLLQRVKNMEEELVQRQNFLTEFEAWKYEGELIESDFEVIS